MLYVGGGCLSCRLRMHPFGLWILCVLGWFHFIISCRYAGPSRVDAAAFERISTPVVVSVQLEELFACFLLLAVPIFF